MNEHETRERANAWIARFAPLVMHDTSDETEVRRRIAIAEALRADVPDVTALGDDEVADTLRRAAAQLDSVEDDLRRRLARLDPGDPAGRPDLETLNDRLQERLARQEMGLRAGEAATLVRKTSPGNPTGAAFLFIFGLGWTAFTTVHACFMIGGLFMAFGFPALALLLFYAIFFAAGYGMLAGAVQVASSENLELEGNRLTVTYRFGPRRKAKLYELPPGARAEIADVASTGWISSSNSNRESRPEPQVVLTDLDGKTVGVAKGATPTVQARLRDEINDYLAVNA